MTIAGGPGSLSASGKAAWNAAAGSIKGGGGLALAFTGVIDCIAWWDEYSQRKKDFVDLAVLVGLDVLKAGIAAAATSIAVALITVVVSALSGFAAPVFAIVVGTVIFMGVAGYFVDLTFQTLNINERITTKVRELGDLLYSFAPKDYENVYDDSRWSLNGLGVGF